MSVVVHRFGPFELDPSRRQFSRAKETIRLSTPQFKVLLCLVLHANTIVPKDTLIDEGWGGAAITENSLEKVISYLRKVIDEAGVDATYIETVPHQGYRLHAQVQQARRDGSDAALDVQLAPYLKLLQGQMGLETLDVDEVHRARLMYQEVLSEVPDDPRAHLGMGLACGLLFEATRLDPQPDIASLDLAVRHARAACASPPVSGEALSALSYVTCLSGDRKYAAAAARKAMDLDPEDWRRALLGAHVSWGEERLRCARRVLTLCPGLALAHWHRVTVFIARGADEAAFEELRLGCAAQDAQPKERAPFRAVGLHLLHGLLLAALGRFDEAIAALQRELTWAGSGQLYARETAANTLYAIGALALRQRKRREAEAAFTRALTMMPLHVSATAALHGKVPSVVTGMDAAIGESIILELRNRHADAAHVYYEGLSKAPPGPAGYLLPVEPILNARARREIWAEVLALVRVRAT